MAPPAAAAAATAETQTPLVLVLGAGVVGLTTAIRLLECYGGSVGLRVHVVARRADARCNVSYGCGGLHMPFHIEPLDKVVQWSRESDERFWREATEHGEEATGVSYRYGGYLYDRLPDTLPEWHENARSFRLVRVDEWREYRRRQGKGAGGGGGGGGEAAQHPAGARGQRRGPAASPAEDLDNEERRLEALWFPDGYVAAATWYTPIVNMAAYMPYLVQRFERLGGKFVGDGSTLRGPLGKVFERYGERGNRRVMLVNATGLGARALCHDANMRPARGVVLRVRCAVPGFLTANNGPLGSNEYPTYIIPRGRHLATLGGTYLENDWRETPTEDEIASIKRRCAQLMPEAFGNGQAVQVESTWAGLRPVRDAVRLEIETDRDGRPVLHNYGHGGGGVTVSWGCANEAAALVGQYFYAAAARTGEAAVQLPMAKL